MLPDDAALFARLIAKTQEYLDIPCVIGHERTFLQHLERDFSALGASCTAIDGGLVIRRGDGPVLITSCARSGLVDEGDGFQRYCTDRGRLDNELPESKLNSESLSALFKGSPVVAYDTGNGGRLAYADVKSAQCDGADIVSFMLTDMIALPADTPIAFTQALDRSRAGYVSGLIENVATLACLRLAFEFGLEATLIVTGGDDLDHAIPNLIAYGEAAGYPSGQPMISIAVSRFYDAAPALAGAVILRRRDHYASFDARTVADLEAAASKVAVPMIFKDSFIERENDARQARGLPPRKMGHTQIGALIAQTRGHYTGASLQLPVFMNDRRTQSTSARALLALTKSLLAMS